MPDHYSPISPLTPDTSGGPQLSIGNGGESGENSIAGATGVGPPPEVVISKKKRGKQKQKQSVAVAHKEVIATSSSPEGAAKKAAAGLESDLVTPETPTEQQQPSPNSEILSPARQETDDSIVSSHGEHHAQADEETLRLWRQPDEEANTLAQTASPTYNLEDDEFQNVWSGGGSSER